MNIVQNSLHTITFSNVTCNLQWLKKLFQWWHILERIVYYRWTIVNYDMWLMWQINSSFIATKWAQVQSNPSSNCGALSNPIWNNIEIVFWLWYLIIDSYQLLSIASFYHYQIYYDNIVTNLMASLMLINNYKSTILNHNSCHRHIPNYYILRPSRTFYNFQEPSRYL